MVKKYNAETVYYMNDHSVQINNADGFSFNAVGGLKSGTYHWTAYYWDD